MDILNATDALIATELNATKELGPDRLETIGSMLFAMFLLGWSIYAVGRAHALEGMSDAHTIRRHIDTIVLIVLTTLGGAGLFMLYAIFRDPLPIHDEMFMLSFLSVELSISVNCYALMYTFQVRDDINDGEPPGSGWGRTHLGPVRGSGGGERKGAYQPLISPENERGEA